MTTRGKLLVALPALGDPNFDRTVVYVLEHNEEGAFGLVLNRPGDEPPTGAIRGWADAVAEPASVFVGGPVQTDAYVGLAEVPGPDDDGAWATIGDGLGTVDLSLDAGLIAARLGNLRIFRGYSGWGPAQLDGELGLDAWLVVEPVREDLFTADPATLWRRVLRRQPGRTAWLANFPADLSDN